MLVVADVVAELFPLFEKREAAVWRPVGAVLVLLLPLFANNAEAVALPPPRFANNADAVSTPVPRFEKRAEAVASSPLSPLWRTAEVFSKFISSTSASHILLSLRTSNTHDVTNFSADDIFIFKSSVLL